MTENDSSLTATLPPGYRHVRRLAGLVGLTGVGLCAMEVSSHALVMGRVDGVVFAANFGLIFRVPSGPVIVTESAAISCTRQLPTLSPSETTIGLSLPSGAKIARLRSEDSKIPVRRGKSIGAVDTS